MSITLAGKPLTQPQLDAMIPILNLRPMPRGRRFEEYAVRAMAAAGHPFIYPPPRRVQRRRTKGFRLPEHTICVDRSSPLWGNPVVVGEDVATPEEAVAAFREYLKIEPEGQRVRALARLELPGWNLACFCEEGRPCHGDVLLEIAAAPLRADFEAKIRMEIVRLRREASKAEMEGYRRDANVLYRRAFDYREKLTKVLSEQ